MVISLHAKGPLDYCKGKKVGQANLLAETWDSTCICSDEPDDICFPWQWILWEIYRRGGHGPQVDLLRHSRKTFYTRLVIHILNCMVCLYMWTYKISLCLYSSTEYFLMHAMVYFWTMVGLRRTWCDLQVLQDETASVMSMWGLMFLGVVALEEEGITLKRWVRHSLYMDKFHYQIELLYIASNVTVDLWGWVKK